MLHASINTNNIVRVPHYMALLQRVMKPTELKTTLQLSQG
jgi:hypothetical protein